MTKEELTEEYAAKIASLLPLAIRAYGSRDTVSPQHDASREYTRLLCEYYKAGGSLLSMAEALGVTYAGLRRRVTTAELPASSKRPRKKFAPEVYAEAVADIMEAKNSGITSDYHRALKKYYDLGLSLATIATQMGLSSANPLYWGVDKIRLQEVQ